MTRSFRFIAPLMWACLLGLALGGCGAEPSSDLGDWTLTSDELTLGKDLQVSETDLFYFGSISDLDVTTNGRMVVADGEANHVKVLRPDGTLLDTLGRGGGGGPGEFRRLSSIQAARGDSIYAFDPQRSRLTVFASPSYEISRTVSFSREASRVTDLLVLEDHFAGFFNWTVSPDGVTRPPPSLWRLVQESGAPGDTLFLAKSGRFVVESTNGGIRGAAVPFDRYTEVVRGPDSRLYHGWTDSLHIQATSLDGTTAVLASVPVTEAERDSVLKGFSGKLRSLLQSALPSTKPAFTDLVVADDGRLWVERPAKTAEPDTTTWWVLDPESKTIHDVRVPSEIAIEVVQDGTVYGTTETETGAPALVRYRIETSS